VSPRFSIVYPTRHRPEFIEQALRALEAQDHDDFEVVVADNFVDPSRSCEEICRSSPLPNLTYVRPPDPLSMTENWSFALPHATGDYIGYLTDKMFVLPGALNRVEQAMERSGHPEIVSWPSDAWQPASFEDYFGEGTYWTAIPDVRPSLVFRPFSPGRELNRRGAAKVSRGEQTSAEYCRGKLAFGVYRRELVDRIVARRGALFHNINPDYTSMVLGLAEAESAIEMVQGCVVSINTDLSNGRLTDRSDVAMREFLDTLSGGIEAILPELFVPGLYASQHNGVAHDYVSLRRRFGLRFTFDVTNWLVYCHEDIYRPTREWSSPGVEAEQKAILGDFISSMGSRVASAVSRRLARRAAAAQALRQGPPPRPPRPIRAIRRVTRRLRPEERPIDRAPIPYGSIAEAMLDPGRRLP
jgi:glycosyltransferase involved in cell wall biosynthesis